jgi:hypothetical protein
MLLTACTNFSIATSTEGTPTAATEIDFFCGSRVRLPTKSSVRQKTLIKQTKSLQRRERRMCAMTAVSS